MPPRYRLTVISPDRAIYQGRVEGLVAPGVEGYFGVLAHHAPMVAELGVGELDVVTQQGQRTAFALAGGVLEVTRDGVTVLADAAEAAEGIDVTRARAAQARAEGRLHSRASDTDVVRAQAALQRALNRLRVAHKSRTGGTGLPGAPKGS